MERAKTVVKYILSFLKKDWQVSDYPIRFKHFEPREGLEIILPQRFKPIPWSAQIINWYQMGGCGDTKEQAYKDLVSNFEKRKADGKKIPRPGTGLPLELAPVDEIERYDDLAADFFPKVMDREYSGIFISDESSIWDFMVDDSLEPYYSKIREVYGVDVSDSDGNFAKIFGKIAEKRASQ